MYPREEMEREMALMTHVKPPLTGSITPELVKYEPIPGSPMSSS